jgi:hypothetical protein
MPEHRGVPQPSASERRHQRLPPPPCRAAVEQLAGLADTRSNRGSVPPLLERLAGPLGEAGRGPLPPLQTTPPHPHQTESASESLAGLSSSAHSRWLREVRKITRNDRSPMRPVHHVRRASSIAAISSSFDRCHGNTPHVDAGSLCFGNEVPTDRHWSHGRLSPFHHAMCRPRRDHPRADSMRPNELQLGFGRRKHHVARHLARHA